MNRLRPPLAVIEDYLFGPSDELIRRWSDGEELPMELIEALERDDKARRMRDALCDSTAGAAGMAERGYGSPPGRIPVSEIPPLPDRLAQKIRQRAAVHQAGFSKIPKVGRIVRIDEVLGPYGSLGWDLPRPLAALLSEPTEIPEIWYGWLVASETDYAGYWDLLLGPEDQPCDPLAGMVQVWNPVHVYLPSVSGVLAELGSERLDAVRALALECLTADEPDPAEARPGGVLSRVVSGHAVRTGTPLGEETGDPRWRYQALYGEVALALREPARLALKAVAEAANKAFEESLNELTADLRDIIAGVRDWAKGWEIDFTPSLAQAMDSGPGDAESVAAFDLGGLVRLGFDAMPSDRLHLSVTLLADCPLTIRQLGDGRTIRKINLQDKGASAILSVPLSSRHTLRVDDASGSMLFEIPIGAIPD